MIQTLIEEIEEFKIDSTNKKVGLIVKDEYGLVYKNLI